MIRIWPEETSKLWAPEFIFGVATAAYQIEGATQVGNRLPSIWDIYAAQSGRVVRNEDGYNACDHYHRWQSDIALIKDLGVDAYRLSLAWPRLINEDGRKNTAGLDFYKRLLDHLNAENISPFVTLYHWDLPQWMEERGGWTNREMIYRFTDYADIVSRELAGRVTAWTTFNEPWCSAYLGYATAEHAPGRTNIKAALQAAHHIMLAHGQACQILRQNDPQADVGIVLNLAPADAARQTQADQKAARLAEVSQNDWFLNPLLTGEYPEDLFQIWPGTRPVILEGDMDIIQQKLDFLGVNYYYRKYVTADGITGFREAPLPETAQRTTMGWEIYPQGLTDQLLQLKARYSNIPPIYITENGMSSDDHVENGTVQDTQRVQYFQSHLSALSAAIDQGVEVKGYFAWSLMDNYEWSHGYAKRFGLYYVNYETQERTLKLSGQKYKEFLVAKRQKIRRNF